MCGEGGKVGHYTIHKYNTYVSCMQTCMHCIGENEYFVNFVWDAEVNFGMASL